MVRHVIVWTLKDEYSDSEKEQIKAGIKEQISLQVQAAMQCSIRFSKTRKL